MQQIFLLDFCFFWMWIQCKRDWHVQTSIGQEERETLPYPDAKAYMTYMRNRSVVVFKKIDKPQVSHFTTKSHAVTVIRMLSSCLACEFCRQYPPCLFILSLIVWPPLYCCLPLKEVNLQNLPESWTVWVTQWCTLANANTDSQTVCESAIQHSSFWRLLRRRPGMEYKCVPWGCAFRLISTNLCLTSCVVDRRQARK